MPSRLGAVLPAAAVRPLRDGAALHADTDVPEELARQFGAQLVDETGQGLLLTLDAGTGVAARWVATGAIVLATSEPRGAALLDAVGVMDRLRSPGGCPWDAQQTHRSLTTYLVEETYEVIEAIETGDRNHLREELGDLLLQIAFRARVAAEDESDPWTVDDVAGDIVTKLVRRHPHVFGPDPGDRDAGGRDAGGRDAAEVEANWHTLKAAEKGRESAVDGVPVGLPALSLAAKLMHRAASH
ncbi:MAG: MazG family protein, partial [Pseudonocardiaceae bacterium]